MLDKVTAYIESWHMLEARDNIIVGISGGADSVCLLLVLKELQRKMDFNLIGVHVNHMLRPEAAKRDQDFAQELCRQQEIPCLIYQRDVELIAKERKQSIEEAGRDVRREVFEAVCRDQGTAKIALAHHQNDNAETFLMNLARGTGLRGMGGMPPVRGNVIRPLLCVNREEIEQYLSERDAAYCEDLSNQEDTYTRNRIRHHIIPYLESEVNPRAVGHINESMEQLRQLYQYLKRNAASAYQDAVARTDDEILIKQERYAAIDKVLRPLLWQQVLAEAAGREKDITAVHLKDLDRLMTRQVGRRIALPYGLTAVRCYEGIVLLSQKAEPVVSAEPIDLLSAKELRMGTWKIRHLIAGRESPELSAGEKTYTKQFDYDIIKDNVTIRTRRPGDYITIDKDGNTQKLKAYFINEKIPEKLRDKVPLIAAGSHILWVAGYRRGMAYRVNEHTKKVLQIEIHGGEEDGRNN